MAYRKKTDSFRKILIIVLGIVFGVSFLAISYKAATTSREDRSKAAEEETIVKQWEFNGNTTEGWTKVKNKDLIYSVSNGFLHIITGSTLPKTIYATDTYFSITGIKKVKINIRLSPIAVGCPTFPSDTANSIGVCATTTPNQFPMRLEVHYFKKVINNGNTKYEEYKESKTNPMFIDVPADGRQQEYTLTSPDTLSTVRIDKVELRFGQVQPFSADIDYIRIVNTKIASTPPPCYYKQVQCIQAPCPTIKVCPTSTISPTPPEGCQYLTRCAVGAGNRCTTELVCPNTSVTVAPRQTVTRTGTVTQDNLEGKSRYLLTVSRSEIYQLSGGEMRIDNVVINTGQGQVSQGQISGNERVPSNPNDMFKPYIGQMVIVTGYIIQPTVKKGFATSFQYSLPLFVVQDIHGIESGNN